MIAFRTVILYMLSIDNNLSEKAFEEICDNYDILEKLAITIIKNKKVNISNDKCIDIINDFRNFVEAFPILLKSYKIQGYLSRTKTNVVLCNYFIMLQKSFGLSNLINVPTNDELESNTNIDESNPIKLFYNTQTVYVIYNMFRFINVSIDILKKIIENYNKFIKSLDDELDFRNVSYCEELGSIKGLKYGKIIRRLMLIEKCDRQFRGDLHIIIKQFILDLRKDLIKINVNKFNCEKIIRRIIKSFDWRLNSNTLDYGI